MSQKSCSATGPASRHSSKQGEEAEKRHSPLGLCLFFYASSFGAFSFHILSLVFLLSPYYLSTLSRSVFCLLHFTFRASFSVLCRLTPCLCTLPFVLCLPCVIGRRRILHHFVSCTSPFALHFSVLCRLAPCLLHFVSQFLTFHNCAARRALSEPPVSKHHCFRCHASTMPPLQNYVNLSL